MIAFDVRHYDSIGSTNDEALRLAREGAAHATVVCAREQISGRGRHGRQWHSPAGNLYVSILLRLNLAPARAAELGFVTALAVADMVDGFLLDGIRATLKWPNDVLVGGAKIAGILIEHVDAATIVGIGVNIAHTPVGTPYPVTCLIQAGSTATPEAALRNLLAALTSRLADWQAGGFATTRTTWLARAHEPGTPVRVTVGSRVTAGVFVDLGPDGALLAETTEGVRRFVAGEVSVTFSAGVAAPHSAGTR